MGDFEFTDVSEEFVRIPGLYHKWEFQEVMEAGNDYHIEKFANGETGEQLYRLYWRELPQKDAE